VNGTRPKPFPVHRLNHSKKGACSSATKEQGFRKGSYRWRAQRGHSPANAKAALAGSNSLDEAYNDVQIATGKINDTIRCANRAISSPVESLTRRAAWNQPS
jgi:hypothetical protein